MERMEKYPGIWNIFGPLYNVIVKRYNMGWNGKLSSSELFVSMATGQNGTILTEFQVVSNFWENS